MHTLQSPRRRCQHRARTTPAEGGFRGDDERKDDFHYLSSDEWVLDALLASPRLLDDVDAKDLRPDLFPGDAALAHMLRARDRLREAGLLPEFADRQK